MIYSTRIELFLRRKGCWIHISPSLLFRHQPSFIKFQLMLSLWVLVSVPNSTSPKSQQTYAPKKRKKKKKIITTSTTWDFIIVAPGKVKTHTVTFTNVSNLHPWYKYCPHICLHLLPKINPKYLPGYYQAQNPLKKQTTREITLIFLLKFNFVSWLLVLIFF